MGPSSEIPNPPLPLPFTPPPSLQTWPLPMHLPPNQPWDTPRLGWWEGAADSSWYPGKSPMPALTLFLDVEWMPIHTRACVGTLVGYTYSLGQFLLAGVAYAVPHWRHLQLTVSVPFFAFFIYSWWVRSQGKPGVLPG